MNQTNPDPSADPSAVRRYLLGTASPAEQERIESRLLTDRDYFDEVSACEDELLDEYVCGRLSAAERENFETVFLAAPARQQKLRFAHALRPRLQEDAPSHAQAHATPPAAHTPSHAPAHKPSHAPAQAESRASAHTTSPARAPRPARASWFGGLGPQARFGFVSVVLLAVAGSVLLAVRVSRQTIPHVDAPAAHDTRARESRPHESPAASAAPAATSGGAPAPAFGVTLTPGLTRDGGGVVPVEVPAGFRFVRFKLRLAASEYSAYNVSVETFEGGALARMTNLPADTSGGPAVFFQLPAEALAPGDYRVKLSGLRADGEAEPLPSYAFRVPRR